MKTKVIRGVNKLGVTQYATIRIPTPQQKQESNLPIAIPSVYFRTQLYIPDTQETKYIPGIKQDSVDGFYMLMQVYKELLLQKKIANPAPFELCNKMEVIDPEIGLYSGGFCKGEVYLRNTATGKIIFS